MEERQRRSDVHTAKAVARGLNILAIRNRSIARNYMEYKRVPAAVITRVLNNPSERRVASEEQAESEAITPSAPSDLGAPHDRDE